jgi:GT2 family glycosyltransferase
VFGACAGAALYRRELIEDVGFLDEDFFLNFEDTDLSFRARLRGWSAWFCREAIVHHRISASQGTWSPTNAYFGARNHLWVCAKNMPAWLLVKYAPLNLLQILVLGVVALRRGCGCSYLLGLGTGLAGLPRMVRKRRRIMARRTLGTRDLERWLTPLNLSGGALRRLLRNP